MFEIFIFRLGQFLDSLFLEKITFYVDDRSEVMFLVRDMKTNQKKMRKLMSSVKLHNVILLKR